MFKIFATIRLFSGSFTITFSYCVTLFSLIFFHLSTHLLRVELLPEDLLDLLLRGCDERCPDLLLGEWGAARPPRAESAGGGALDLAPRGDGVGRRRLVRGGRGGGAGGAGEHRRLVAERDDADLERKEEVFNVVI